MESTRQASLWSLFRQSPHPLAQGQEGEGPKRELLVVGLIDSFAVVVITALAYVYYLWWSRHPLYGRNKGPKIYPIVGSIVSVIRNLHRLPDYTFDLISKVPGRTIRNVSPGGRESFTTANPANVEHILKTNFENYPKGKFFHGVLRELLGDGIFNVDDHLWKVQRKKASHVFKTSSLRDFVVGSAAREASDRLIPFLSQASQSGQPFDLQDIFARFAFDSICQLGFGEDPSCLDISLPRVRFAEAFDRATLLTRKRFHYFPRVLWTIQRALNVSNPNEMRLAMGVIDEFAMRVIKNRREELARGDKGTLAGKGDLLSVFMTLSENEDQVDGEVVRELSQHHERKSKEEQKMRREDIDNDTFLRDMIISFILAGRDTTTSALSWFFWLLSTHPHVESAILEEISQMLSCRPPAPAAHGEQVNCGKNTSTCSFEELKQMHYLHAALTESMRLYPPVPSDAKSVRQDDVWPDGTVVKANSIIVYHPYTMGRLEELWGKDCLEFKPERWLEEGVFLPQSPYKYTVFQAGPRICLGKDMVMLQMKLVSVVILSNFEICVPEDYKPQYLMALTMNIRNGFPVTVRERKI